MKKSMNRKFRGAILALSLCTLPVAANAAEDDKAKEVAELNEAGASYYARRDYRKAIEKFIQAYAVDPDPNLLFNIARCYEGLGETAAAIEKYEAYLQTPGADAKGRKRAQESLRLLRDVQSAPEAAPADAPAETAPAVPVVVQQEQPSESNMGRWLALAGGVVSAGAGLTFYLMGSSDHGQITGSSGYGDSTGIVNMSYADAEDLKSSGDTKKLVGAIGMGIGGALLGTYAVIVLTDNSEDEQLPSGVAKRATGDLALGLVPSREGGLLSLKGRF